MSSLARYAARIEESFQILEEGTSFLQKPFTPDAVARAVRATLDAANRTAAPAGS